VHDWRFWDGYLTYAFVCNAELSKYCLGSNVKLAYRWLVSILKYCSGHGDLWLYHRVWVLELRIGARYCGSIAPSGEGWTPP
jgi:hypothetical protein